MDPDAAELSSMTTTVSDLARRVAGIAERRGADPDDPLIGRLHEVERTLLTAERRFRAMGRVLD